MKPSQSGHPHRGSMGFFIRFVSSGYLALYSFQKAFASWYDSPVFSSLSLVNNACTSSIRVLDGAKCISTTRSSIIFRMSIARSSYIIPLKRANMLDPIIHQVQKPGLSNHHAWREPPSDRRLWSADRIRWHRPPHTGIHARPV